MEDFYIVINEGIYFICVLSGELKFDGFIV